MIKTKNKVNHESLINYKSSNTINVKRIAEEESTSETLLLLLNNLKKGKINPEILLKEISTNIVNERDLIIIGFALRFLTNVNLITIEAKDPKLQKIISSLMKPDEIKDDIIRNKVACLLDRPDLIKYSFLSLDLDIKEAVRDHANKVLEGYKDRNFANLAIRYLNAQALLLATDKPSYLSVNSLLLTYNKLPIIREEIMELLTLIPEYDIHQINMIDKDKDKILSTKIPIKLKTKCSDKYPIDLANSYLPGCFELIMDTKKDLIDETDLSEKYLDYLWNQRTFLKRLGYDVGEIRNKEKKIEIVDNTKIVNAVRSVAKLFDKDIKMKDIEGCKLNKLDPKHAEISYHLYLHSTMLENLKNNRDIISDTGNVTK